MAKTVSALLWLFQLASEANRALVAFCLSGETNRHFNPRILRFALKRRFSQMEGRCCRRCNRRRDTPIPVHCGTHVYQCQLSILWLPRPNPSSPPPGACLDIYVQSYVYTFVLYVHILCLYMYIYAYLYIYIYILNIIYLGQFSKTCHKIAVREQPRKHGCS